MGKLIYSMLTSLDGYVNEADGGFEWATPDEELHTYINSVSRSVGTCLLGRRMYETMAFWEDPQSVRGEPPVMVEYAEIWQGYDKVVHSTALAAVRGQRIAARRQVPPRASRPARVDSARVDSARSLGILSARFINVLINSPWRSSVAAAWR
jgi:RibD C-terminal domain